jgi:hypothetical protein
MDGELSDIYLQVLCVSMKIGAGFQQLLVYDCPILCNVQSDPAWAPSATHASIKHSKSGAQRGMCVKASRTLYVGLIPHEF